MRHDFFKVTEMPKRAKKGAKQDLLDLFFAQLLVIRLSQANYNAIKVVKMNACEYPK